VADFVYFIEEKFDPTSSDGVLPMTGSRLRIADGPVSVSEEERGSGRVPVVTNEHRSFRGG
jgi:hypothetical protein